MDADRVAADAATRYLAGLDERRVAPPADAVSRLAELGGPLPDAPCDPTEVVRLLDEIAGPAEATEAQVSFLNDAVQDYRKEAEVFARRAQEAMASANASGARA